MRIAISGATGFVGRHLTKAFVGRGWSVTPLGREDFRIPEEDLARKLEGVDVLVNLAGASVASRWTEEYKKNLRSSRIDTTRKIVGALGLATRKPRLFVSTSAIGIYDTRGEYTEENAVYADDFLGRLAADWEAEAKRAEPLGIRTVIFRFGIVLGGAGGALEKMLIPFRMGLGGVIGDGRQPFSWVHIEDLTRAYLSVIENEALSGTFNLTAPTPTTNEGLTRALAKALHRPAFLRVPAFVLRLQFGEGAKVLMEGQRVLPERLLKSGFVFRFSTIEEALSDLIGGQR